ncbi:MAG: leucyl/phenylalanyl-tRNA--protein transferase [Pseudomonadota bacterium]
MKDADFIDDLTPEILLKAYAAGVFPMADSAEAEDVFWVEPRRRGILPLERLHISRSLRKRLRRADHEVRVDTAFDEVVAACADRPETWINAKIIDLYGALHRGGHAHSVEVWSDNQLIGGLYGVRLGAAFFGESMFSRERDASKIALVHLVARLIAGDFRLLDTQFVTDHLLSLGAVTVSRPIYRALLAEALSRSASFDALPPVVSGDRAMQEINHTS